MKNKDLTIQQRNAITEPLVQRLKDNPNDEEAKAQLYIICKNWFEAWYINHYRQKAITTDYYRRIIKDLSQDLYFEMIQAIEKYNTDKGISFLSYIVFYFKRIIQQDMSKYTCDVYIPSYTKEKGHSVELNNDITPGEVSNKGEEKTDNQYNAALLEKKLSILTPLQIIIIKLKYKIIDVLPEGFSYSDMSKWLFENNHTQTQLSTQTISFHYQNACKALNIKVMRNTTFDAKKYRKKYYSDNAWDTREKRRAYRNLNEEKIKAYQKNYRKTHKKTKDENTSKGESQ